MRFVLRARRHNAVEESIRTTIQMKSARHEPSRLPWLLFAVSFPVVFRLILHLLEVGVSGLARRAS